MGKVAQNITLERVAEAVEAIAINGAGGGGNAKDWASIRNLVRAGMGPKAYPVGTQLLVEKENSMTASMGTHTGITAVSVTEETFLEKVGIVGTGVHEFKFDGAVWIFQEEAVNITEYGIAHMKGKTLRERARALIGIAHPSVVDDLSKAFEERFNTPYVDE
jgi:hypothetical protein